MKTQTVYLPLAVLAVSLTACTTPKQDTSELKAQIDASMAGHYGQAILHEEKAEENLETANHILEHWENGYYWNIDEKQQALAAARAAAEHKLQSEKEMCAWLTEIHGHNHHQNEPVHHVAAYFKTGSAVPFKTDHGGIGHLGHYLGAHPDAKAAVTASADTVGKSNDNLALSKRRADTVVKLLIDHGAKAEQLTVSATGEGQGPDNTPNQDYRVATVTTSHPKYLDCPNLK